MIKLCKYVACICEGTAEQVIIELLLDEEKLIFSRSSLLEHGVIRCRSAKKFEETYLRKGFSEKITVFRVLDSRRERFALSKAYENKADVINIITAPEIEMLIILNEGKYSEYKKSGMKPSEYCKVVLKYGNVKSREFIMNYFKNTDMLVSAVCEYKRISKNRNGEFSLSDILR